MKIPLVDLQSNYVENKTNIDRAIQKIIKNSDFILGEELKRFERNFAHYCESKYCVGTDNGLSALELGIRALRLGKGDEIITPVNSFIASSSAISLAGAKPVWADVNENTYNLDPKKIIEKINKKTKAIMIVHLYGQPAEIDEFIAIAKKYHLFLIEDACQAHGAKYKNKKVGQFGDFAAFSFYPGKNLGAFGDGGALVTNNKKIFSIVQQMRNYGQVKKYDHKYLAFNRRLDTIQAAILNAKLINLNEENDRRVKNAELYTKRLTGLPLILPQTKPNCYHVFHQYVIRTKNRNALLSHLQANGVQASIHYPITINNQKVYKKYGQKEKFKVSEKLANEIISLPIYPSLSKNQINYICNLIKSFYEKKS